MPAPAAALLAGKVAKADLAHRVDPAGTVAKADLADRAGTVGLVGKGKVAGIAELLAEKLSCACYP